jgi:hypothetical protein
MAATGTPISDMGYSVPFMTKKTFWWYWGIGLATGLYATFVLQQLWNWFIVPALNVSAISFWVMCGLYMFAKLFTQKGDDGFVDEGRWEAANTALDACVPEERRAGLNEQLKKQTDAIWTKLGLKFFGRFCEYSAMLAIGWGIHTVVL